MNDVSFDTLARDTQSPQGRRVALKALGVAAVAAMASSPLATEAKKKNKRRKKQRNRQECPPEDCTQETKQAVDEICQALVAPCEEGIRFACSNDAECLASALPCCDFAPRCDGEGFLNCLLTVAAA